jgi:hypothetical protein
MGSSRRLLLCVLSLFLGSAVVGPARSQPDEQEIRWAEDVLLRPIVFRGNKRTGVRKWLTTPKLAVKGATAEQKMMVEEVVKHLNETLKDTPIKRIEMVKPNDPRATIKVQFARRARIPAVAQAYNLGRDYVQHVAKTKPTFAGAFHPQRNNPFVLVGGTVILSSDKEDAAGMKNFTLILLCQVLGLGGQSQRDKKSIFYLKDDRTNGMEELSDRDRKLLIWCYNHVPPGTDSLKALYDKHWPKKE